MDRDEALPMCLCAEQWDSHPPDCPVRQEIERLRAALARSPGGTKGKCKECGGGLECVNPGCADGWSWWSLYRDTPCANCGHVGKTHDSEDGNCETHRTDGGIGVCSCDSYVPIRLRPYAPTEDRPEATDRHTSIVFTPTGEPDHG